jgi:hypothetical protein
MIFLFGCSLWDMMKGIAREGAAPGASRLDVRSQSSDAHTANSSSTSPRYQSTNFDTKIQQHRKHADLREDPYVARPVCACWNYTNASAVTGKTITLEVESSDTIGTHALDR